MTVEEKQELENICLKATWDMRTRLKEFLANTPTTVAVPEKRSNKQNKALHAWFSQIAQICQDKGVTFNLIMQHTHDVEVTPIGVKGLWHVLQKALYGTKSTTELTRGGQIDTMVDHFCSLFGKEGIVLPPFPSMEHKLDYPEYNGPPTI